MPYDTSPGGIFGRNIGSSARHSSGSEEMTAMMFGYGGTGGGWPVWGVALMGIGMLAFLGVLIWAGYALMTNATSIRCSVTASIRALPTPRSSLAAF